jgi:hypothetical protein
MKRGPCIGALVVLVVLAMGCHEGDFAGTGSDCSSMAPCRAAFMCVAGRCELAPVDAASDLATDGADAASDEPAHVEAGPEAAIHDSDAPVDGSDLDLTEAPDLAEAPDLVEALDLAEAGHGDDANDAGVPDGSQEPEAGDAPDAASDADASDGGSDLRDSGIVIGCDPRAPFDTVVPLSSLADSASPDASTAYDDISSRLSADELNIFFSSNRTGTFTVYGGRRATISAPFTNIEVIPVVNNFLTSCPTVTADQLTMYMDSTRSGRWSIYRSTRASVDMPWSTPVSLASQGAFPAYTLSDSGPYILPDGSAMYFHSMRTTDNANHIYRAERVGDGFPLATQLASTAGPTWEVQAAAAADDLTLYFGSDRNGSWDIWVSRRETTAEPFGAPTNVVELNTSDIELPGWISPDSCRLYFERRVGDIGHTFVATRRPPSALADGGADGDAD